MLSLHSEFLKSLNVIINAIINAIIVCIVITKNEIEKRELWCFSVDLIDSTMASQGGNLLVHLNGLMPQLLLEN